MSTLPEIAKDVIFGELDRLRDENAKLRRVKEKADQLRRVMIVGTHREIETATAYDAAVKELGI